MTGPKLVRDRVPELAAGRGGVMPVRTAPIGEMPGLLRAKLTEETAEYWAAETPGERLAELADVLEVVVALAWLDAALLGDVDALRRAKRSERGGFAGRLVWSGEVR